MRKQIEMDKFQFGNVLGLYKINKVVTCMSIM